MQEFGYVFNTNSLMGTVSVEYLPRQVANNVVGDLWALTLDHETDELGEIGRQVLLVVQELNNLRIVVALEEFDLTSIFLHTQLKHVEEHLFKVCHFDVGLVMLQ